MPSSRKKSENDEGKNGNGNAGHKWALNDRVLCRYPNSDIYYEAKIIDIKEMDGKPIYAVHYQGWNARHDEKIPELDALERFKIYTQEEAERARDVVKKAQQVRNSKKRKSGMPGGSDADSKQGKMDGDTSSRASTPSIRSQKQQQGDGRTSTSVARGQSSAASTTPAPVVDDVRRDRVIRKIVLPYSLRKILTDDHALINTQHMLPKLPARYSVQHIVDEYRKSLKDSKFRETAEKEFLNENPNTNLISNDEDLVSPCTETCDQSALGLLDYFDMTVGSLLLYKFEKPMFSDLYAKEVAGKDSKGKGSAGGDNLGNNPKEIIRYSKHFGLVHFLRLFTRFTDTLEFTHWSSRALDVIVRHAQDFVVFLGKRHADFYDIDKDYEIAPPEYLKRVWGGANQ